MTLNSEPPLAPPPAPWGNALKAIALLVVLTAAVFGGRWLRSRSTTDAALAAPKLAGAGIDRGELVFQVHCAKCHGPDGHGEPEAMERLRPPPRDFASRPWRFKPSLDSIRQVTLEGIPNTAMPAHGAALSPDDLERVVAHTYRLATTGPIVVKQYSPIETALTNAAFVPVTNSSEAPELRLSDAAGRSRSLADERGRFVMLHFWGVTCEHCLAGMPKLQALADRWEPRGLTILNVCADSDSAETAQQVVHRVSPKSQVWIDETGLANSRYEVHVLPTVWLLDSQGRLLGSSHGMQDWQAPAMQKLIETLIDDRAMHGTGKNR